MKQEELADLMGTKQPAIARIERGDANLRLQTLVKIAEALNTTVRIDLEPAELLDHEVRQPRWWERQVAFTPSQLAPVVEAGRIPAAQTIPIKVVRQIREVTMREEVTTIYMPSTMGATMGDSPAEPGVARADVMLTNNALLG